MKIIINGDFIPEFYIQTFSLLFFPDDNNFGKNNQRENYIKINKSGINIAVEICYNKKIAVKNNICRDHIAEAGRLFYEAASELTGIYPPWGIHTGIRPAKTAGDILIKNNFDEIKTINILRDEYLMRENKAALALKTYKNGAAAVKNKINNNIRDFSLYISVPFCLTKCKYCSFVSFATPRLLKLIPEYINKLIEELKLIGEITRGMDLKTVYIGGGTPTVLDCETLEILLNAVKTNFDLTNLEEYTAECGRADTITEEKLAVLKNFGVDRISVNPQTLNDEILKNIGRGHTSGDFFKAFDTARKSGIKNINADFIIGLPGENKSSMINTIKTLADLKPANITAHSFCLKKSAEFKRENYNALDAFDLNCALETGYDILNSAGYKPYYMYRQKYAAGNLENTGFCLENCECLYNIYMMDEVHTIFGAGAGAMTKFVRENKIERVANYKYPYEYIKNDFKIIK